MNKLLVSTSVVLAVLVAILAVATRKSAGDIQAIQRDLETVKNTTNHLSDFHHAAIAGDAARASLAVSSFRDFCENPAEPVYGDALNTVSRGILALEHVAIKYSPTSEATDEFVDRLSRNIKVFAPRDTGSREYVLDTLKMIKQTDVLTDSDKRNAHEALSITLKMIETHDHSTNKPSVTSD